MKCIHGKQRNCLACFNLELQSIGTSFLEESTQQFILAKKIEEKDLSGFLPSTVVGFGSSVYLDDSREVCIIVAFVMNIETLEIIETVMITEQPAFSYFPGMYALRIVPLWRKALNLLKTQKDLLIVPANGQLHPRMFGAASSFGLEMKIPTIGVTQSLLGGIEGIKFEKVRFQEGIKVSRLSSGEKVFGVQLQFPRGKPLYVSIGHQISLETAVKLVIKMSPRGFLEPLRKCSIKARDKRKKTFQEVLVSNFRA